MGKPNARDRILTAAGQLFHHQGYSNVGINEIIKQADTAKASFYQHFRSKEALCEAWLQDVHDRSETSRADIIAATETSVEDRLITYYEHLSAFLTNSNFRGCPYTNTSAMVDTECTGVVHQIRMHKESLREFFVLLVQSGYPDGDTEILTKIGNQLFILYSGAATESQNLGDLWPVESAKQASLQLLSSIE